MPGSRRHCETCFQGGLAECLAFGQAAVELSGESDGRLISHSELIGHGGRNAPGEECRREASGERQPGASARLAGVQEDEADTAPNEQAA